MQQCVVSSNWIFVQIFPCMKSDFTNFLHFFTDFFKTALLCELFIIPIILVWILLVHKRTMPFTEDHKSIHRSSNFILIFLVTIFCQIILVFVVWIFSRFFFRIMILMVVMMMMSSFGSTSRWRRLPGWWFSLGWGDGFLFSDYFLNKQNSFLKNYIYITDLFHCFFGKI